MPGNGCRKVAITFNHLEEDNGMTVSKTFVANVLREEGYRVAEIRRKFKNRTPRPVPRNVTWGLDLTFLAKGEPPVLGLIDHGTRACVRLQQLPNKSSLEILQAILDSCRKYGKPKVIRTDNESVFVSRFFGFGLWVLRIRHQRTAPFAPWQNGRIERLFGTFKAALQLRGAPLVKVEEELHLFRTWYNHVRPHQHLDWLTPAEAWDGMRLGKRGEALYFNEWDGALTGFYFPREVKTQ